MKFWSFEYVDDEGDLVTTNFVATKEQVEGLMQELARLGIKSTAYDLSPSAVSSTDVPKLA